METPEKKTIDQNNLTIGINHKFFIFALTGLLKFVKTLSETKYIFEVPETKLQKSHSKLRETCSLFINGLDDETLDQGRIIKKIYKTISKNLDKLYPTLDVKLFAIKNEENKIVTIIPMIDIGLIVNFLSESELVDLCNYINTIYLSVIGMLFTVNKKKIDDKTNYEIIRKIKEQVLKSSIMTEELVLYSSYLGGTTNMSEYDISKMFENINSEKLEDVSNISGIKNIIKMTGIDKMLNFEDVNEQLQNVSIEDIDDAAKSISKIFGGAEGSSISNTCSTIAKGFIGSLQSTKPTSFDGLIDTIVSSASNIKVDTGDFEEMSSHISKITENVDMMDTLKNMKDEKGNNIGDQMASVLEKPIQTLNNMKNGKMPNMSDITGMFGELTKMMNKK
jgi:hypothetical protein